MYVRDLGLHDKDYYLILQHILYILVMQCFRVVHHGISHESLVFTLYTREPLGECVCNGNNSDEGDILWYTTRKPCITILYHVIENMWHCIINAVHDGKVVCDTIELH